MGKISELVFKGFFVLTSIAVNINGSYVNDLGIFWRLHIASKKMVKGWVLYFLNLFCNEQNMFNATSGLHIMY